MSNPAPGPALPELSVEAAPDPGPPSADPKPTAETSSTDRTEFIRSLLEEPATEVRAVPLGGLPCRGERARSPADWLDSRMHGGATEFRRSELAAQVSTPPYGPVGELFMPGTRPGPCPNPARVEPEERSAIDGASLMSVLDASSIWPSSRKRRLAALISTTCELGNTMRIVRNKAR